MIPKITQAAPNISEQYWCSTCGRNLPSPNQNAGSGSEDPWRFCPGCGEPIEYEKAEPVHWQEQDCVKCGCALIRLVRCNTPFFQAKYEYVGAPLCRNCLEEHCVQTNCLAVRNRKLAKLPLCRHQTARAAESKGERYNKCLISIGRLLTILLALTHS